RTFGVRFKEGPKLYLQELRVPQPEPHAANAEGRIRLRRRWTIAGRLVSTNVERTIDDGAIWHGCPNASIQRPLLIQAWRNSPAQEQQLGSQQTDPVGSSGRRLLDVADRAGVALDDNGERDGRQLLRTRGRVRS